MTHSTFPQNLKKLIDSRGITQQRLSEDTGLTTASISRYVSGLRSPEARALEIISQYFNVSVDWLLGLSEESTKILPKDTQWIIEKYTAASAADKTVIKAILSKYDS